MTDRLTVYVPTTVVSEANRPRGEHWGKRTQRKNAQQASTLAMLASLGLAPSDRRARFGSGAVARLTRIGGQPMDSDNLARAFKAVRDAVAHWLGIDDGSPLIAWTYDQRPRTAKEKIGIEIEIRSV